MAEILKLETNVAYELAMKFDSPKIVDSTLRKGEQNAMITLVDGRITFVPLLVADQIGQLGIVRNVPFILCHREIRTQTGKALRWEVKPIESAQPEVKTPTAPASAPQTATNSQQNQQHANGSAPAPIESFATHFMGVYKVAIDVLLEARTYAQSKGLPLEIHCEDVRALAATIIIPQKGGR